jgi:hypothetical protein
MSIFIKPPNMLLELNQRNLCAFRQQQVLDLQQVY